MARLSLTCRCGWHFFISDTTQSWEVACPSCGDGVPVPGRQKREGGAVSAGQIAREKASQKKTLAMLAMGLVLIVAVVGFLLLSGSGEEPPTSDPVRTYVGAKPPPGPQTPLKVDVVQNPTPVKPLPPSEQPGGLLVEEGPPPKQEIDRLVSQLNMAGIVSEILRHRGSVEEYEKVQKQMVEYERRIDYNLERLADRGERHAVPAHMRPGDRLAWFADRDLSASKTSEAAGHLEGWLRLFHAGAMGKATLLRGGETVEVIMFFQEKTKELVLLAGVVGIVPGETSAPSGEAMVKIPEEVARPLHEKLAALQGYRPYMTPGDRERLDGVLRAGKGLSEDIDFLRARILGEVLPVFEQDMAAIRARLAELEPKAMEVLVADVVFCKDGRRLEGRVEKQTEESIQLRGRLGSLRLTFADDILRIEKGKGSGVEFPERYKAAKGKLDPLHALLAWCKEKNLPPQREFVAHEILSLAPATDKIRAELKLPKPAPK